MIRSLASTAHGAFGTVVTTNPDIFRFPFHGRLGERNNMNLRVERHALYSIQPGTRRHCFLAVICESLFWGWKSNLLNIASVRSFVIVRQMMVGIDCRKQVEDINSVIELIYSR